MEKIKIAITGRVASVVALPEVVADNAEYEVDFALDPREGWDMSLPITALFVRRDGSYTARILDAGATSCKMPPQTGTNIVYVGLTQDDMRTTTPAAIKVQRSIRTVANDPLPAPTEDVYAQILEAYAGVKILSGKGAPTSATQGKVNQLYRDEDTQRLYICTATDGGYTWAAVSGGSVDVDATLTKAGYAADAKAAGDAIEKKIDAPQVAQVGEVLTVEEVDADGKPKKWKTQTVETAPPDWMENDSNNTGFVKNRTHYKKIMAVLGNPGYKVNLLDGTHRVGDIILLQSGTTNTLQKFLMRGINSPDWDIYELCMLIKETDNNDKTYNLEVICKNSENIVEVNTLSEGNIKVLYSEQKKAFLAYYFISNLSTLSTDDKTKFTQTGVYVQLVGNDYSEYAELWATYRLYLYTKLSNKYLNIKLNPPIPQPLRGNEMIATEQTGENEFGYTLRPIPNINDFIGLGITAAQVGQIIKVKAVDGFGNPHEWEAVDKKQICCPQKTTKECGESETITLADNAEYRLTNVTALTFAYPENDFECWIRLTIAESGDVAVVFPEGTKYIGSAPTFANGEMWELSIKDCVVIAQKVGDGT